MRKAAFVLLLVMMLLSTTVSAESATAELEELYAEAELLMVQGKYAEAGLLFESLGAFSDASQMAMYCKAIDVAESKEMYNIAVATFDNLGDFKDSKQMAIYYTARGYEAIADSIDIETASDEELIKSISSYKEAEELYSGLMLFKDCLTRLTDCQNKRTIIEASISNSDGLKDENGIVVADGDNWLIVNGASRGNSRYYKVGEMGEIEGYDRETGTSLVDANIPLYTFKANGEGGAVTEISVTTSHNTPDTLGRYTSTAIGSTDGCEVGGILETEFAGRKVTYFTYTSAYYEAEAASAAYAQQDQSGEEHEPNRFTKAVNAYIAAEHDSSIVFHVTCDVDSADAYPEDEAMMAALEQAVAAVTLEEGK